MIPVKLTRDEARAVQQYFFLFLDQLSSYKLKYADTEEERLQQYLILDQYDQVKKLFEKKLLGTSNSLLFNFTDSQAIILHKLLLNLPIEAKDVYLVSLRILICNLIYAQITEILFTREKELVPMV